MKNLPVTIADSHVLNGVDKRGLTTRDHARAWRVALWERRCSRLSTQVLGAFDASAKRKYDSALSQREARAIVARCQNWSPRLTGQATIESARATDCRDQLRDPGALMLAGARHQDCTLLLTEDLRHGQQLEGIRVVNPFIKGTDILNGMPA